MLEEYYRQQKIPSIGIPVLNKHIIMHNQLTQSEPLKNWTSYKSLGSGIINKNYKVVLNKKDIVAVKILSNNNIGISREDEFYNYKIANKNNIAPDLIHCDIKKSIVATEFIEGGTLNKEDLLYSKTTSDIIQTIKKLHSSERFKNNFDIFQQFDKYLNLCYQKQYKLPKHFLKYRRKFKKIRDILEFNKLDLVPCHNDLWVNNILRDVDGLKFIDFELSGNNDPRFELGNFWQESGLSKNYLSEITTKYFEKKDEKNELISEAYGIAAAYTWSLVGIILSNESKIEYDYKKFSEDKLMFVKENLTPQFIRNMNKLNNYKKWNQKSFLKDILINPN